MNKTTRDLDFTARLLQAHRNNIAKYQQQLSHTSSAKVSNQCANKIAYFKEQVNLLEKKEQRLDKQIKKQRKPAKENNPDTKLTTDNRETVVLAEKTAKQAKAYAKRAATSANKSKTTGKERPAKEKVLARKHKVLANKERARANIAAQEASTIAKKVAKQVVTSTPTSKRKISAGRLFDTATGKHPESAKSVRSTRKV